MKVDVLLVGTGSLARAFCYSLASMSHLKQIKVAILGRSIEKSTKIAAIANNCAAVTALSDTLFIPEKVSFESEKDLKNKLAKFSPKILLQMASCQSPWEFCDLSKKWSKLVNNSGFGLTLPLQSFVTLKIAKLLKEMCLPTILVNACYPDLVNSLLKFLGFQVTCGIGNVSILAAAIRAANKAYKKADLKILGHHLHLTEQRKRTNDYTNPKVWIDGNRLESVELALKNIRSIKDQELNQLTALISVQTVLALLNSGSTQCNLPGPNGLPGGYPVTVTSSGVVLNLPPEISEEEAITWNTECSKYDGAFIDKNGFVWFNEFARDSLRLNNMKYAKGFYCEDVYKVCEEFIRLRESLR